MLALKVAGLNVYYKDFHALWDIDLEVQDRKIISIIGANGAGKSTLLNTIAGILSPTSGYIEFFGQRIEGLPSYEMVSRGLSLVPEGRRIFPRLSVYENLVIGSYLNRSKREENLSKIYNLFPVLRLRSSQMGNTLSGGEQQMLAIGRALMSNPKVILCDEISLGLAPLIIKGIYREIKRINNEGITVVLVEQDITRSLKTADYAYFLLQGKVVLQGPPSSLNEEEVKKAYFGI